jgi:hypothetical protein
MPARWLFPSHNVTKQMSGISLDFLIDDNQQPRTTDAHNSCPMLAPLPRLRLPTLETPTRDVFTATPVTSD